jgi:hypothetical protein
MPRVNFRAIPDSQSFDPLPDGIYEIEIENCTESMDKNGDARFKMELIVVSGKARGRKLFDSISFHDDPEHVGMRRMKLVVSRLGFLIESADSIEPTDLIGRKAYVTVSGVKEWIDKDGIKKFTNKIPFDGYRSHSDNPEEPLPF